VLHEANEVCLNSWIKSAKLTRPLFAGCVKEVLLDNLALFFGDAVRCMISVHKVYAFKILP
jgi:hypothetical protein